MTSSTIHQRVTNDDSHPVRSRALLSRAFRATLALIGLLVMAVPADALIIRDMCNQTSGDGQGHSCPPGDYLLVRPKYTTGQCGDWMCCPANGDGSYNCDKAVNPTSSTISGALKGLLGPRATVLEPAKGSGNTRPVPPGTKAPINRRGLEGEPQEAGKPNPSGTGSEGK